MHLIVHVHCWLVLVAQKRLSIGNLPNRKRASIPKQNQNTFILCHNIPRQHTFDSQPKKCQCSIFTMVDHDGDHKHWLESIYSFSSNFGSAFLHGSF